ncbi:YcnI family protein [Planosporangium sp. 12N6]|uniref:YcnI family protein n=1 Tax=Planosporangium spinosum TaxID=3402278 RepID=UPI003CEAFB0F
MNGNWRTVLVVLGAAVVGSVALAAPAAAADVTVTPSQAPRGGPAELAFQVPEERPGAYTTKVELVAPEATPIAEIYPMSVDNWAPSSTMRTLDHPVELIHGTQSTEVTATVTWIRVGGPPADPSTPDQLRVSLGPMPDTDRVAFTIVQTYSDGTVVRWADQPGHRAPVVTLIDDPAAAGSHNHEGGDAQGADAVPVAQSSRSGGGMYGILGAGLLVGLAAGLGLDGWLILRAVRRTDPAAADAG